MAGIPARGRAPVGWALAALALAAGSILIAPHPLRARAEDPGPPDRTVKLVFVHHSCGENWLADDHGKLGEALGRNNYFVSDTNYGWGPDGIGDRTDITDWPEWFGGSRSPRIMQALRRESGQHSPYRRSLPDPGGENRIVLFKSCFPNSNLEGVPDDPPRRGHGLTVGNAKAIYQELLAYFRTQPQTLFVAITAPPVQDPTHAANARAFNDWLVHEWLAGYPEDNVAVFDFYNVLTGRDNHHRFHGGAVQHTARRGSDTLRYPTNGDDHPSPAGNRKATRELVPLLNVYYHRWARSAPSASEPAPEPQPEVAVREAEPSEPPGSGREPARPSAKLPSVDDFEDGAEAWAVFSDASTDSRLRFSVDPAGARSGKAGLRIDYDVAPASWGTCSLVYPSPRDWSDGRGLSLHIRAGRAGQPVVIVAYQGQTPDDLSHFEYRTQTDRAAVESWRQVEIPWSQLVQPAWQGDPSVPFDPKRAMGVALAFDAAEAGRNTGTLWVDEIRVMPGGGR